MKTGRRGFLKMLAGGAAALGFSKAESKAVPKIEKNDDMFDSERARMLQHHSETMSGGISTWATSYCSAFTRTDEFTGTFS